MDLLDNAFDAFEDDGVFDGIREETQSEEEEDDELTYYKEENHLLKKEVKELRKALRLFTQQPNLRVKNISEDGPVAQLVLFNKPNANELAEELREVIMDTVHKFQTSQDDYLNKAQSSAIQYPANNNKYENKKTPKEEKKSNKVYTATHAFQFFKTDNFYLDQLGASYYDPNAIKFGVQYACLDAMNGEIEELSTEPTKPKTARPDKTCWNCGNAGHQLPECPEPRNQQKINQARSSFMERSQQFGMNGSRYCNDENDNDVRFAKFQPGQISDELREAMGLKPQQLPLHIYRMRKYGYPPGHLLDAVMTTGLNLYKNSHDHEVSTQNEDVEEQTDVSKLISYPGFNVEMTTPYIEECHQLGMPQMNCYGLKAMKDYYNQQNDVIKSKLKKTTTDMEEEERRKCDFVASKKVAQITQIVKDDDTNPVDMELSDNEPSDWQVLDETSQSLTSLSPYDKNEERSAPLKEQPEVHQMEQQIETTDEKMDDQQSSTNAQETTEKYSQEQKQSPEEGEIDDGITIETETHYIVDETGVNCTDLTEEELAMRRQLLNEIKEAEAAAPATTTDDKEHSQKEDGNPAPACNEGESVEQMEESPVAEVASTPIKSVETATSDGNAFKTPSASPFGEGVPHRSSFAKGITPFTYDDVTPSKGIYKKLKTLLKK